MVVLLVGFGAEHTMLFLEVLIKQELLEELYKRRALIYDLFQSFSVWFVSFIGQMPSYRVGCFRFITHLIEILVSTSARKNIARNVGRNDGG